MTVKQFEAVLSVNDLAEKIGELYATSTITTSDATYMLLQLEYIKKALGESNQPSHMAKFQIGANKVFDNPEYYGLGAKA